MERPTPAVEADWLTACRNARERVEAILADRPTTAERVEETGARGEGGDLTLVIDGQAEDAMFAQLDALHAAGHRFTAVSEERGEVGFGDGGVRLVIDAIDGSMKAKRALAHHALSDAVARSEQR